MGSYGLALLYSAQALNCSLLHDNLEDRLADEAPAELPSGS